MPNTKWALPVLRIIRDSFQEYEGEHSVVLFTKGCSASCTECYNADVVCDPNAKPMKLSNTDMGKYITPLHTAMVLLGGEPLMHGVGFVAPVLQFAKAKGLKTKVFTNGLHPETIQELIDNNLVDAFSIDYKCYKDCCTVLGIDITDEKYKALLDQSIAAVASSVSLLEIRTTKFDSMKGDIEDIKTIVATQYKGAKHIIQEKFRHGR